jgi:flagellar FliJ protein
MKRFVWRLQRVLDIKIKEEQVKRAELLEITEKLMRAQTELIMQKRILADTINNISQQKPKQRLDSQELFLTSAAVNDELIRKLGKHVIEIEKQQQEKISEVMRIKQFRKSLEKLREETKMQFIKEQEKLDQKDADDLTTISYSRRIMHADNLQNKEMSL